MDANEYRKSNIITILSNLIMDHFGMRVPQDRVSIVITCEKDSWKKEQMNIIFFSFDCVMQGQSRLLVTVCLCERGLTHEHGLTINR